MSLSDKQDMLFSRLNNCPARKPVEECPIRSYRDIQIDKRQMLISNMRREAVDGILEKCLRCSGEWDKKGHRL